LNNEKFYSFLGIIQKSGNLVSGYNTCIAQIKNSKCKLVIIAEDASENTRNKFLTICNSKNIEYKIYGFKENIGLSIGKSSKSVLIIKDENMSKVVLNMFE